jgi:hypothetical protein
MTSFATEKVVRDPGIWRSFDGSGRYTDNGSQTGVTFAPHDLPFIISVHCWEFSRTDLSIFKVEYLHTRKQTNKQTDLTNGFMLLQRTKVIIDKNLIKISNTIIAVVLKCRFLDNSVSLTRPYRLQDSSPWIAGQTLGG